MTAFFEAFNPAARHWREQQDLDKVLVVDTEKGSNGPRQHDLDSGVVHLRMPRHPGDAEPPNRPAVTPRTASGHQESGHPGDSPQS